MRGHYKPALIFVIIDYSCVRICGKRELKGPLIPSATFCGYQNIYTLWPNYTVSFFIADVSCFWYVAVYLLHAIYRPNFFVLRFIVVRSALCRCQNDLAYTVSFLLPGRMRFAFAGGGERTVRVTSRRSEKTITIILRPNIRHFFQ